LPKDLGQSESNTSNNVNNFWAAGIANFLSDARGVAVNNVVYNFAQVFLCQLGFVGKLSKNRSRTIRGTHPGGFKLAP